MSPSEDDVPSHQTVRSVVKATRLLLAVADSGEGLTATRAAEVVGIPLATAYHLLNTLLAEGMLSRDEDRRYHLGPKIATLLLAYEKDGPSERLLEAAQLLADRSMETAYVSGWRNGQVAALATIEGSSTVRVGQVYAELRGFEHARASGKVMLAHLGDDDLDGYLARTSLEPRTDATITDESVLRDHLKAVRAQGFALDDGEFDSDIGCVAAPIFEGEVCIGVLGLSAPRERFHTTIDSLVNMVRTIAAETSQRK